jgi:uncharacterized protein (DUF2267 family)
MIETATNKLEQYYETVQNQSKLLTNDLAKAWSKAVLNTMGIDMSRGVKKELAQALPEELGEQLGRVFWLLHFRNTNVTAAEFQQNVARRSGQSDQHFAIKPIKGVFHALKQLIDTDLSDKVADDLSPELSEIWKNA